MTDIGRGVYYDPTDKSLHEIPFCGEQDHALLTLLRKVRPYLDNFAGIQEEVDEVLENYKGVNHASLPGSS